MANGIRLGIYNCMAHGQNSLMPTELTIPFEPKLLDDMEQAISVAMHGERDRDRMREACARMDRISERFALNTAYLTLVFLQSASCGKTNEIRCRFLGRLQMGSRRTPD